MLEDCTVVEFRAGDSPERCASTPGHSALPDAEANVIRNLMERIDDLENTVTNLQRLQEVQLAACG